MSSLSKSKPENEVIFYRVSMPFFAKFILYFRMLEKDNMRKKNIKLGPSHVALNNRITHTKL